MVMSHTVTDNVGNAVGSGGTIVNGSGSALPTYCNNSNSGGGGVDAGNHRLLQLVDGFIHFQRGQDARIGGGIDFQILASADAEKLVAGSCQHDHAGADFAADFFDAIAHFMAGDFGKHIAVIGTVERDGADGAVFFVKNG